MHAEAKTTADMECRGKKDKKLPKDLTMIGAQRIAGLRTNIVTAIAAVLMQKMKHHGSFSVAMAVPCGGRDVGVL